MDQEHNKYKEVELILGSMVTISIDGVCFILDFTGIGDIITPFIQSAGTACLSLWAWRKGDKASLKLGRQATKYASNALPWLPTLTAMFLIEAYMHNHPEKFALAQKAMSAGSGKPAVTAVK
ncbi:MAG: hypothetical protein QMD65_00345 [Patescibacteria group bacterium]|nr:hypothetical protein [Patescibacteria group bacterium]